VHDPAQNAEAPVPRVLSERVRVASAALEATLAVPGVAGADAGRSGRTSPEWAAASASRE